ncbi:MAG: hypothetical protein L0Y72_11105 [Gemmataceae bacterium]|nr:hypothetical protein [Gemmataceae bacterium]MCI0739584.1 hypothetical protein [Gemmataceae bacterium]
MKSRFLTGAFVLAALVTTGVAGEALKSGLQVGKSPHPFHPLNLTGKQAGKANCLV